MGPNASTCAPESIANQKSRALFEDILRMQANIPEKVQKSSAFRSLVSSMFESLKRTPEQEDFIPLMITGADLGPAFIDHFMFKLPIPPHLTKISFRKSSIKPSHIPTINMFITSLPNLNALDLSENDIGDAAASLLVAICAHPSLRSIHLENCKIPDSACPAIISLIKYGRRFECIQLDPVKVSSQNSDAISVAIKGNHLLTEISINKSFEPLISEIYQRNSLIIDVTNNMARYPFQRLFRAKLENFKSVKGREMLMQRADMKNRVKGTDLFKVMDDADKRAKTLEDNISAPRGDRFRSGMAEMLGRRPSMEDVSIVMPGFPNPGSMLFGLFDGHGGREAAEFASKNLPNAIAERIKSSQNPEDSIIAAFKHIQADMKPWCVYVGTTSVVAIIEGNDLTVSSVGDSRCVLCRDGKAQRLTVDHKPDLPEETAYIVSKGGFVRDGRVGGMLAVSRALGDGFLGDAVNCTPHITRLQLSERDSFMIFACDGVWDVMSDQEAVDLVSTEITPLAAARKLRDKAFDLGSTDNISVIVVFLAEVFANEQKAAAPKPSN